ncbi:MAG: carbohydrate binding family 9 domain-containing protein, partial [Bacteroidetes bacterium]|nr:carbohydrate binding family 9 domain-containing protein [Bacteroidota bacterium]
MGTLPSAVLSPSCPEDCRLSASYVSQDIEIDGVLNEEAWLDAAIATDFTQYSPNEGDPATQQTEVRVLYGESQIFISAVLQDTEPEQIRQTLGRRDEFNQADWFIASIDSYLDRKTAYNFAVNAAGVQADGVYTGERFGGGGGFDFDTSWNAVWRSAVRSTPEGWIVEMRIPFTMLRFSDTPNQRWGINFRRVIPRLGEVSDWVLIPRAERRSGTVAQYGTLEGIIEIRPRRNIQVTPYTVGNATRDSEES